MFCFVEIPGKLKVLWVILMGVLKSGNINLLKQDFQRSRLTHKILGTKGRKKTRRGREKEKRERNKSRRGRRRGKESTIKWIKIKLFRKRDKKRKKNRKKMD